MTRTFDAPNNDDFQSPVRLTVNPVLEYPFRQDLTAVFYRIEYVQRSEFFVPLALDTTCPDEPSAFLVNESNPALQGSGLVRWTRTFSTVPATREEWSTTSFSFPAFRTDSNSTDSLRSGFTQTVVAKVEYSYVRTTDPGSDLTITTKFQPTDASGNACNFVASDTTPTKAIYEGYISGGTYIQAQETKVQRWQGNIWQLENRKVKAL